MSQRIPLQAPLVSLQMFSHSSSQGKVLPRSLSRLTQERQPQEEEEEEETILEDTECLFTRSPTRAPARAHPRVALQEEADLPMEEMEPTAALVEVSHRMEVEPVVVNVLL